MKRVSTICIAMLFISHMVYAQSDREILDSVRANGMKVYLEQASWTLPESFRSSGLAPSDKQRLTEQWAKDAAACLADALAKYAESTDVPLSEMVSDDGTFSLKGDGSRTDFVLNLDTCIETVWAAIGARLP